MPASTSSTTSRRTRKGKRTTELPVDDRALSVDEALSVAVALQQAEQWAAAAEIYEPSSRSRPTMPARCISPACSPISRSGSDDAVALIARSLELEPDRPDWHSNFGIVLQDRLRLDEAIAAYEQAIALDANHANAHNNLGVVLRAKGRVADAEAAYRAAIEIDPEHADAHHNLGVLLNGLGRERGGRALLLEGDHAQAEASRSAAAAGSRALHAR